MPEAGIKRYMVITDDQPEHTDTRELLSRACAGESGAFCLLTEPLQARLLRQALGLAGDLGAAEDLVSETLVEAWKSLRRYNQSCRLSTWLYSILLHRHYKSVRRARSRPVSLAGLPVLDAEALHEQHANLPSAELSPAEVLARRETNARVRQFIDGLPEKHRQVILLRFFEEASLPDMAAVLGVFGWHGEVPAVSRAGKIAANENEPSPCRRGLTNREIMKWIFNRCERQRQNAALLAGGALAGGEADEVRAHLVGIAPTATDILKKCRRPSRDSRTAK